MLDGGTLWITTLGLGLRMLSGEILAVHLRKPENCPREGLGPLTPSQRELSTRPDLPVYLLRQSAGPVRRKSWLARLLTLAMLTSMGLLVWQAIDYQQQWNAAPVVEGTVIEVQPGPPDPFPTEFTVAYQDQAGAPHQVVFQSADVYLVRSVGDKVEIRYLPAAPDQPMGPARFRDAAFLKYVPWGVGIMMVYLLLRIVLLLTGGLWQKATP